MYMLVQEWFIAQLVAASIRVTWFWCNPWLHDDRNTRCKRADTSTTLGTHSDPDSKSGILDFQEGGEWIGSELNKKIGGNVPDKYMRGHTAGWCGQPPDKGNKKRRALGYVPGWWRLGCLGGEYSME